MKALTVKLPWAWLLIYGPKDIENRMWFSQEKGDVAIHCSKTISVSEYKAAERFIEERGLNIQLPSIEALKPFAGSIIGIVDIVGCVRQSQSRWFVGKFGFVCRSPKAIKEPITLSGRLGFWDVPVEESQLIQDQLNAKD